MGLLKKIFGKFHSQNNVEDAVITKQANISSQQDDVHGYEQVTLKEMVKNAYPSKNGLYPHEIAMLAEAERISTDSKEFAQKWKYNYYIDDPQSVLHSLFERGFIKKSDLESALKRTKMDDLKSVLREHDCKVSGKKAELIERLLSNLDHGYLERRFPERYYVLTDLGRGELEQNEYIMKSKINVWEMNRLLHKNPSKSYRDITWSLFNEWSEKNFKDYNWGLYRNDRLTMYEFLMEENKIQPAFALLSEVIYYDLSGLSNGSCKYYNQDILVQMEIERCYENNFPYKNSMATIAPGVLSYLSDMKEDFSWSTDELRKHLISAFGKFNAIRHLFTKEECADIAIAELEENTEKLENIYSIAEKRFKKKYGKYLDLS